MNINCFSWFPVIVTVTQGTYFRDRDWKKSSWLSTLSKKFFFRDRDQKMSVTQNTKCDSFKCLPIIQWCFWFQAEFREEKLNLISNWILGVGDGGPKGVREQRVSEEGGGSKNTHKAEGAHAFPTTSWTSHFEWRGRGDYFSKIHF